MLIAAAVCPHPPLLVPEVASGAALELDELRAACDEAVRRLVPPGGLDLLVVVGAAEETRGYDAGTAGGLGRYGVDLTLGTGRPRLPLSLTIGRWLLMRAGILPGRDAAVATVSFQSVAADADPATCLRLGRELAVSGEPAISGTPAISGVQADSARRVALLVMGDGTSCRTQRAPGYLDERAEGYDAEVARALSDADTNTLARLDPGASRELRVAGRAAWQVLAGAAEDGSFAAELLAAEAPYGVGYFVASWRRRQPGRPPG